MVFFAPATEKIIIARSFGHCFRRINRTIL